LNKNYLISKLGAVAPLELQEAWDCCGWVVEHSEKSDVQKIMFALTVTEQVYEQAKRQGCDLIVAHHPLFAVPLKFKGVQIYCAHTNLDKAQGGTTDTVLEVLGLKSSRIENEFVRIVELEEAVSVEDFADKLRKISPNLRYVNNLNVEKLKIIAFCAGSGSEFISQTEADAFVTGDLKYHAACEADKVIYDIGHFESEILIKEKIQQILGIEGVMADEKSPFI